MKTRKKWIVFSIVLLTILLMATCKVSEKEETVTEEKVTEKASEGVAEEELTVEGGYQIPAILEGKYNIAFVYYGAPNDSGWSQSHEAGREYVENNVEDVHTAYVENVLEGADAELVIRSLANQGFDVIFTTSFWFMDASEIVAAEFPSIDIIHISGFKSNEDNFGNLMGAMENMSYLAGMIAGSRAKVDGNPKLGYLANLPLPKEFRIGNAFALGAQNTCPECIIDVNWTLTKQDATQRSESAQSLFDAGAQVVMNGTNTPLPTQVVPEGKWIITNNYYGNCTEDICLTSTYWRWGPLYAEIVEGSRDGTWVGGWEYFDADVGGMGLLGFMEDEELQPGVADLSEEDLQFFRDTLGDMLAGDFDRFDVFAGPITDNQGNVVLEEGEELEQADLDGFKEFGSDCETCMYWWNENITTELPKVE